MVTNLKKIILNPKDTLLGFHLIQLQENVGLAILDLIKSQFLSGVFVEKTLASGTDNIINHGLGVKVQGWTIVGKNANADIWESSSTNSFPDKQLLLRASATVTAKLYIF